MNSKADARHAKIDRQYAKKTQRAIARTRMWFVGRAASDAECAELLNDIDAAKGYVHDMLLIVPAEYVVIWWEFV